MGDNFFISGHLKLEGGGVTWLERGSKAFAAGAGRAPIPPRTLIGLKPNWNGLRYPGSQLIPVGD